jgi:hypothetical protein
MRFDLYYANGDVMIDTPENRGFDPLKIWALLGRLKQERGIQFRIIDVSNFTTAEIGKAYEAAVVASVWNRYRIRKVFGTNSSSASFFGKGIPALLVHEGERPVHVFPHEEAGVGIVTIRKYLESLLDGNTKGVELARRMDELRSEIGPIGISTSELVREGRRR